MRSVLILLCIALQLAVLGYMIYGRESVVSGGQRIYMATAPIDPRDPFRGDFVRLRYPVNNINSAPVQWSEPDKVIKKGDVIYALLEKKPSGLYEAVLFTDTRPKSGLFIRGRSSLRPFATGGNWLSGVRFGIEQLFVEQGSGLAIEEKRGIRGGLQTAMEVEIAVNSKGTAVLTDYRWSDLAIQIELTQNFRTRTAAQSDQTTTDLNHHITLSVQNVSEDTVTLNNPGDNCGFRLEPADRESRYSEASNSCADLKSVAPLTLEPGQMHNIEIDLTDPRWFMNYSAKNTVTTGDLRTFESNEMIRIVYRGAGSTLPPSSSTDNENPKFWSGDLLSQGFNARGRVD